MPHLFRYEPIKSGIEIDSLLINLLDPLVDAGHVMQALDAAISDLDSAEIASFDSDEIFDYRAQRPIVTYRDGKIADFVTAALNLKLVTDIRGVNFLYLCGQEPDYRWAEICRDLIRIVKDFRVKKVFSFAAMAAAVPHTRPADMLLRSTKFHPGVKYVQGQAEHYAALSDYFEFAAAKDDLSVTNLRVRVPFYIAQSGTPFISGALALAKMTADLGGPSLPLGDLEQFEDRQEQAFAQLMDSGGDIAQLVAKLEEEYDANPEEMRFASTSEDGIRVPTFEEIGIAAERFLAGQTGNLRDKLASCESEKNKFGKNRISAMTNTADAGPRRKRRAKHAAEKTDLSSSPKACAAERKNVRGSNDAQILPQGKNSPRRRGKHHY